MKTPLYILLYFIIEAVRAPLFCEEWYGHNFTETIDLEAAAPHSVYNRRVVDYFDSHTLFNAPEIQVGVRGCAERITNDQETHVGGFSLLYHLVTATFHEFAVRNDNLLIEKLAQPLVADHQDRCVHFKVYELGALHGFQTLNSDVFFVG